MKTKLNKSRIKLSGNLRVDMGNGDFWDIDLNGNRNSTMKSGVYEILNKHNGKRYIGMARDLVKRKQHHWSDLVKRIHKSKEMQEDFGRFCTCDYIPSLMPIDVDEVFEFNVIRYCRPSELTFYENLLISYLNPEYNTHKKKLVKPVQEFDENGNKYHSMKYTPKNDYTSATKIIAFHTKGEIGVTVESKNDDDIVEEMM